MTDLVQHAAAVVALVGCLAGASVALTTGRLLGGVQMLLDFLLAAGLLRLALVDTWAAIGSVAVVVALRKLLVTGLRSGPGHARRASSASASYGARPRMSLSK